MRLACQEQLLPGDTLEARWDAAQAAGFDGIELRGRGGEGLAARLPELRAAARAGVVMPTVCPEMDHFLGDFDAERRADAIRQMRSQLSVIAELGGDGVLTPASWGMFSLRLPPFTPPRDPEGDRAVLLEGLAELGEHAAREGVWLAVEPINRYEDHMVNRVADAVALIERLPGSVRVGVCPDVFHMNIEEDSIAGALAEAAEHVVHLHVGDSNRLQPGAGHLDFEAVFAALDEAGYDGWAALECRLRGDRDEALRSGAEVLRKAMRA
jgi:sugar phosphate isomerase/epimerase